MDMAEKLPRCSCLACAGGKDGGRGGGREGEGKRRGVEGEKGVGKKREGEEKGPSLEGKMERGSIYVWVITNPTHQTVPPKLVNITRLISAVRPVPRTGIFIPAP